MRGSLKLASVSGIGIFVHWSFLLLIGYVAWASRRGGPPAIALNVGLIVSLFVCVVLHELGHALTARRFGITTRDITLLPIGGVARLERMPTDPRQELLIAIAGPAVNVVIAAVLFAILWTIGPHLPSLAAPGAAPEGSDPVFASTAEAGFLGTLARINLMLVAFNLLPAFPMDGGRVLRAALAYRLDYGTATRIAARIGQVMAGLFIVAGFFFNPWLIFIGLFVFFGAQAETQLAERRTSIGDVPVSEAMITSFSTLSEHSTLGEASDLLLAGSQQDFPVMDGERIVGVLARGDLLRSLASKGRAASVGEVMLRDCGPVDVSAPLSQVFERMQATSCPLVPVTHLGRLVGMLTLENIGEFIMVRSAMRAVPRGPGPDYLRAAPASGVRSSPPA